MAVETGPRRHRGRFDASMDDAALLAAVGDVLRHARPDAPAKVAQRRFDAARAPAGYPACPSARAIVMRFNEAATRKFSWEQIKELALDADRSVTQTLAAARREEPAEHLDERHVFFALRFVAQRSGVTAPTRDQYADGRAKLLAAARRRGDETLADLLPTVGQIEHLFAGDWDAALAAADLTRVKPKTAPPPRASGIPAAEAMAHFVKTNGWWATNPILYAFARDAGIRMARIEGTMEKLRADAAAILAAEGIATLTTSPPSDASTRSWRVPAGGIPDAPPRGTDKQWDEPACVGAVARWLRELPTAAKTTKAAYIAFARGKSDYPSASAFDDYGGFAAMRKKAQDLNAEQIPF